MVAIRVNKSVADSYRRLKKLLEYFPKDQEFLLYKNKLAPKLDFSNPQNQRNLHKRELIIKEILLIKVLVDIKIQILILSESPRFKILV